MCSIYLYYYEDENIFVDEYGEIVWDIFYLITPSDMLLFKSDWDKYDIFPVINMDNITCRIVVIPNGPICGTTIPQIMKQAEAYKNYEKHERITYAMATI